MRPRRPPGRGPGGRDRSVRPPADVRYELPGGPFIDPEADAALFAAIRGHLRPDILCRDVDADINAASFAEAAARALLESLRQHGSRSAETA